MRRATRRRIVSAGTRVVRAQPDVIEFVVDEPDGLNLEAIGAARSVLEVARRAVQQDSVREDGKCLVCISDVRKGRCELESDRFGIHNEPWV